ncbi:MAG: hypothetical protein EAZ08_03610 [Cytophagales bacterium]|nr:MAG: hypothetical protein EAZ08_03610 [Cytophagales bacterium]
MIEKYINELLLLQDRVIVPNLGVFSSTLAPTSLSADGSTIIPPRKVVSFSIYIKEEDKNDDLMKAVMRGENISFYDFNEQLLAFVQQVQQSIIATNSYAISGLGTLIKDGSNKIILLQDEDAALLGDSFGLPRIDTTTDISETPFDEVKNIPNVVGESEKPTASIKTEEVNNTGRNEPMEEVVKVNTTPTATDKSEENDKGNKKNELAWWLAVVPLVFLLTFIVYLFISPEAMQNFKGLFGTKQVSADMNTKPAEDEEEINPIENVVEDTARFAEDEITRNQQPTVENTEPAPKEETIPAKNTDAVAGEDKLSAGRFYLVYGSFGTKAIAQKVSKPLEAQGLTIKIIPLPSKGLFRVVIGDFDSHADATSKKTELGSAFGQTWVLQAQ